jgi:hypothetical protein
MTGEIVSSKPLRGSPRTTGFESGGKSGGDTCTHHEHPNEQHRFAANKNAPQNGKTGTGTENWGLIAIYVGKSWQISSNPREKVTKANV